MPNLPRQEVVICNLQELADTVSGETNTQGCQCTAELTALGSAITGAIVDMRDALLDQSRIVAGCCFEICDVDCSLVIRSGDSGSYLNNGVFTRLDGNLLENPFFAARVIPSDALSLRNRNGSGGIERTYAQLGLSTPTTPAELYAAHSAFLADVGVDVAYDDEPSSTIDANGRRTYSIFFNHANAELRAALGVSASGGLMWHYRNATSGAWLNQGLTQNTAEFSQGDVEFSVPSVINGSITLSNTVDVSDLPSGFEANDNGDGTTTYVFANQEDCFAYGAFNFTLSQDETASWDLAFSQEAQEVTATFNGVSIQV